MDLEKLRKNLLATARENDPSDTVPFAFEKRIMARVTGQPEVDSWSFWNRILWRAAAPCAAMALLLSVWAILAPDHNHGDETLAAELESAMFAPFDDTGETW